MKSLKSLRVKGLGQGVEGHLDSAITSERYTYPLTVYESNIYFDSAIFILTPCLSTLFCSGHAQSEQLCHLGHYGQQHSPELDTCGRGIRLPALLEAYLT